MKETIASVKAQSYKDWEVIIVDDGSDESEYERINDYQDKKIKVLKRSYGKKGPSTCRNIGAIKAAGEFLIFLDSDDQLTHYCLEQRVEFMQKNKDADLGVFLMEMFEKYPGDLKRIYNNKYSLPKDWASNFITGDNPWNVTCPIWRKAFFEKVGGFDEELLFMEDPDLHLRAINSANAKIRLCYDKPSDCFYRINNSDVRKENFMLNSILYRTIFYKKLTRTKCGAFTKQHKKYKNWHL